MGAALTARRVASWIVVAIAVLCCATGLKSPIVALAADATTFQFPLSPWPTGAGSTGYNFGDQWAWGECPTGTKKLHTAIDKFSPANTAVYAVATGSYYGTITDQSNPQWGWAALITHNVPGEGFVLSQYWHIKRPTISPGAINKGASLSSLYDMGSSSHIHFGIQQGGSVDTTNSWAGALPTTNCGGYAKFPWLFTDPTSYVTGHLTPRVDGLYGDVNGDGTTDLVAVNDSNVYVKLSTGTSFDGAILWLNNPSPAPYGTHATLLADVTGNGKADLVVVNDSETWVMLSTGTAFNAPARWSTTPFYGTRATLLADVTGNGKADLVAVNETSTWVMLSTGTGFSAPALWSSTPFYGSRVTLLGDVTGDHKADLVAVNGTSTFVMPSTGTNFGQPQGWPSDPFVGTRATLLGDVSADGKLDLVAVNDSSVWVMVSSGSSATGFGSSIQWLNLPNPPPYPYGTRGVLLGNVIFAGWADLVAVNDGNAYVMVSHLTYFDPPSLWSTQLFYGSRLTI